jgi:putative SOS response-associated peptidase YedK
MITMCGRFTNTAPAKTLAKLFRAAEPTFDFEPRYNVAPTQAIPIVRQQGDHSSRELALARWGLIPAWTRDGKGFINARLLIHPSSQVYQTSRLLLILRR